MSPSITEGSLPTSLLPAWKEPKPAPKWIAAGAPEEPGSAGRGRAKTLGSGLVSGRPRHGGWGGSPGRSGTGRGMGGPETQPKPDGK